MNTPTSRHANNYAKKNLDSRPELALIKPKEIVSTWFMVQDSSKRPSYGRVDFNNRLYDMSIELGLPGVGWYVPLSANDTEECRREKRRKTTAAAKRENLVCLFFYDHPGEVPKTHRKSVRDEISPLPCIQK